MGIERDRQGGDTGPISLGPESTQQPLMPAMDSVEVTDCYIGTPGFRGEVTNVFDRDDQRRSPLLKPAEYKGSDTDRP
jgi:hypothetical protein